MTLNQGVRGRWFFCAEMGYTCLTQIFKTSGMISGIILRKVLLDVRA